MNSPSTMDESSSHIGGCSSDQDENIKHSSDEVLVDLVEEESVLWKRNHPNFKNQLAKEQAWLRIATKLGVSTTEVERRFKSIREKYRRRKILMERDLTNNVESTKLKRWDLYSKLSFLDDFMIPRNGTESLGTISSMRKEKSSSSGVLSSENISSTNEVSIHHPLFMLSSALTAQAAAASTRKSSTTSKSSRANGIAVRPVSQIYSRSSLSTPSPTTTTNNHHVINDSMSSTAATAASLTPIVKMETHDDDEENDEMMCGDGAQHNQISGNFNYVGDFISAELNKLPMRHAFVLKNNLIREVLSYTEGILMEAIANFKNNQ